VILVPITACDSEIRKKEIIGGKRQGREGGTFLFLLIISCNYFSTLSRMLCGVMGVVCMRARVRVVCVCVLCRLCEFVSVFVCVYTCVIVVMRVMQLLEVSLYMRCCAPA
jgi:hypothetical protein